MMVHRKMLALAAGARARIALTVALGLAISGTFVAQGVAVALVVSRILAGSRGRERSPSWVSSLCWRRFPRCCSGGGR